MHGSWYPSESLLERRRRWVVATVVGVVLQVPLAFLIFYTISHSPGEILFKPVTQKEPDVLWEAEPLPPFDESQPANAAALRIHPPKQEELIPPPDEQEKGTEVPAGQIVTIAPPNKEEMPDSGFAARYAQKVERQMRAHSPSADQTPQPYSPNVVLPQVPLKTAGSPEERPTQEKPNQREEPFPGPGERDDSKKVAETKGNFGTGALGETELELPFEGQDPAQKYRPGAAPFASDDYLPGIKDEGDTHLLDTIPFRYAGFFERVKGQVRRHWDPNRVYQIRDPSGELYPRRDRLTVLAVVLDDRGKVLDARIAQPSGLKFLDDEAVRAMWAASPFLNPPKGLIGTDGRVRFQFGFALLTTTSDELFWRL